MYMLKVRNFARYLFIIYDGSILVHYESCQAIHGLFLFDCIGQGCGQKENCKLAALIKSFGTVAYRGMVPFDWKYFVAPLTSLNVRSTSGVVRKAPAGAVCSPVSCGWYRYTNRDANRSLVEVSLGL